MCELKSCPFCGGKAEENYGFNYYSFEIHCRNCSVTMLYNNYADNDDGFAERVVDDAYRKWNTRIKEEK